jgi:hypothetical protein
LRRGDLLLLLACSALGILSLLLLLFLYRLLATFLQKPTKAYHRPDFQHVRVTTPPGGTDSFREDKEVYEVVTLRMSEKE